MNSKFSSIAPGAALLFALTLSPGLVAAKTVTLAMDVTVDTVSPEDAKMYTPGQHDQVRIAYDDTKVNPVTHKVHLTMLAHYLFGHWAPMEVTDASSYNLATNRLDFTASVTHGRPIVALFESGNARMAMLARPDFHVLIAGSYVINPTPLTPAQIAAPPPGAAAPAKPSSSPTPP